MHNLQLKIETKKSTKDLNRNSKRYHIKIGGFTLVEMIIYIALLSMILISVSRQSLDILNSNASISKIIYENH